MPLSSIPLECCGRCGQKTPAGLLVTDQKSFHRGPIRLCINCRHDIDRRTELLLLAAFLLPPLLLAGGMIFSRSTPNPLLAGAAALCIFLLTVVPIHEAAHACMAALFRHRVIYVSIGRGMPLCSFRLGLTRFFLCGWGNGGFCAHLAARIAEKSAACSTRARL